jgi:gliding motility-associated protein GldL
MGMAELAHSEKWKTWTNRVYSVGAAVVLFGALGKLQHWEIGGPALFVGMSMEIVIFLISALEPPLDIPTKGDWERVYPALDKGYVPEGESPLGIVKKKTSIDDVLSNADISSELLAKVRKGLLDFSKTASGIADISSATFAAGEFVTNLNSASESITAFKETNNRASHLIENSTKDLERSTKELSQSYDHSASILSSSSRDLAQTFGESSKRINEQLVATGNELTKSYKAFTESVNKDIVTIDDHTKAYSSGLSHINSSLSALNSSYELHLQNVKKVSDSSSKAIDGYSKITEIVSSSLEEAQKYKKQTEQLNKNLEALNHVYGNMLGAMNVKG